MGGERVFTSGSQECLSSYVLPAPNILIIPVKRVKDRVAQGTSLLYYLRVHPCAQGPPFPDILPDAQRGAS